MHHTYVHIDHKLPLAVGNKIQHMMMNLMSMDPTNARSSATVSCPKRLEVPVFYMQSYSCKLYQLHHGPYLMWHAQSVTHHELKTIRGYLTNGVDH